MAYPIRFPMICNFDVTFAMDPVFEERQPPVRGHLPFSICIISHGMEGVLL